MESCPGLVDFVIEDWLQHLDVQEDNAYYGQNVQVVDALQGKGFPALVEEATKWQANTPLAYSFK